MSFDMRGFERDMKRQVQGLIDDAARDLERQMNGLSRSLGGQPVSMVRQRLRQMFARDGWKIRDPELTEYAEAVRDGVRIRIKAQPLR